MKYFIGTYYNGYCGCDLDIYMIADTEEQACKYMEDGLDTYGYDYMVNSDCDDDEADDCYWENVTFEVREATQEEIDEIDADGWIDIRNT